MNQQVMQERKVQQAVQALRALIALVVLIAVGGGAWLIMDNRAHAKNEKAFSLLFQAEKMESLAGDEGQAQKLDPFQVMANWGADKKKDYQDKLQKVTSDYPQTAAAAAAGLRLGRLYFSDGKYPQARDTFKKVIDESSADKLLVYRAMALEDLASTFEGEKNYDEARKSFESALAIKDNPLKPLAYLGQARSLRNLGKKDEAKAAYEKVIQEFPGTVYARKAKALLNSPEA